LRLSDGCKDRRRPLMAGDGIGFAEALLGLVIPVRIDGAWGPLCACRRRKR
jgi:hypothetical protein